MLNSPFLLKPSLKKTEKGAFQSKGPTPRVSPNLGVPPEGQWEGAAEELGE